MIVILLTLTRLTRFVVLLMMMSFELTSGTPADNKLTNRQVLMVIMVMMIDRLND